jgi:hypothetical protein
MWGWGSDNAQGLPLPNCRLHGVQLATEASLWQLVVPALIVHD